MSRPVDGPAHAVATLSAALAQPRPAWVSAASWRLVRALVASLRTDAAAALAAGPTRAAEALGVGRATLARWRDAGGWLA
jgi:hypothetical protein